MAAGRETFIQSMLTLFGYDNLIPQSRYPILNQENSIQIKPEELLLSSEPFPFKKVHLEYFQKILPQSKVRLVDGEQYSWYGSRILHI